MSFQSERVKCEADSDNSPLHPISQAQNVVGDSDANATLQAETVERLPGGEGGIPPSKIYGPLSFPVVVLLMPASVFGVLARLGLVALMSYDGHSVFPLAYAQAVGCLVMGFALELKEPMGQLYVSPQLSFNVVSHCLLWKLCAALYRSYNRYLESVESLILISSM
jgi:hypothetical protein